MSEGVSFSPDLPAQCTACGESFYPELYVIVHTSERPDLVELIKRDIIHCAICPRCNVIMTFGMPLLIYRPDETVRVIYSPVPGASEAQRDQHEDMLFHTFRERLGESWEDSLTKHIYQADRAELSSLVDLNLDLVPGGRNFQSMRDALNRYMSCATWEESFNMVQSLDILLTREAEFSLEQGMKNLKAAGDPEGAAMSADHLKVLQDCRVGGVQATFAAKCDGTGHTTKGNLIAIYRELSRLSHQPHRAVPLARAGLQMLRREDNEESWARLQETLGDGLFYAALRGDISETDDAAWHYRSALEFFTRERSMRKWVMLSWQLLETVKLTPSYPTVPQLVLSVMCRAEEPDWKREIIETVWPAIWSKVQGESEPPLLADAIAARQVRGAGGPPRESGSKGRASSR